jgi:conjugal transfer mating pair stabilization protein TraG
MASALSIYAYGNVDALHGVLNAVAMIMGSNSFEHMVRLGVVIGFAVVATMAMMPGGLQKGFNWFMAVAVIGGVMLIPKANVTIEDQTGMQAPQVVANVPWTLALLASIKSAIGSTLTQGFETAFQTIPAASMALPAELSYLQHGMMFGSKLVMASRQARPPSLYDEGDLAQFVRNCVLPEMGRGLTPNQMADSGDLMSTFSNSNPALATAYHDPAANWSQVTDICPTVWAKLQPRLAAAGTAAVAMAAAKALPGQFQANSANATAQVDGAIAAIYNKATLAGASATASTVMLQNILINATADAAAAQGASLNDPSQILLASMRTNSVAQMNAGNMVQGQIAEEALPMVRNITEAILFASFPLLCIVLVASEGKAMGGLFKSYVYALLWVELWPPMFAVVNYLQTLESAKHLAGAAYSGSGPAGMAVSTAGVIFSTAVSSLSTTAWMVTFVPVLAAAVIFGFDKIMSITGATGGGTKAAQGEASSATKGNASYGNVSLDQQQLAAYRSDPAMYRTEAVGGVEFGTSLQGALLSQYREASAPVSLTDTAAVTRGMATEASATLASATRHGKAFETSLDAAYGTALSVVKGSGVSASKELGFDVSKLGSDGLARNEVDDAAQKIGTKFGIRDSSAVSKALSVAIESGARGGPKAGALPMIMSALSQATGVKVDASGRSVDQEDLAKEIASSGEALHKTGVQRKQDVVQSFRHNEAFREVRQSHAEASNKVDASWRDAESAKESESADLTRSRQLSAKIEGAERMARESPTRWNNNIDQVARTKFGMSVNDGIADPREWQKVVRYAVESGSLRTDTDDGKPMWIPADPGLGPNIVGTQAVSELAAGGEAGLRDDFNAATPGGGRTTVEARTTTNESTVRQTGARLGVNADTVVTGGNLPGRVVAGQVAAGQAVAAETAAVKQQQGSARVDYDSRARKVSDKHAPIAAGTRNKALDGVDGADGTLPTTFNDEAADVRTKRNAEAVEFQKSVGKAQIPK